MQEKAKEKEAKSNKEKLTEVQKSPPPQAPPPLPKTQHDKHHQDEKPQQLDKRQHDAPSPDIPPHRNLNPEQIAIMDLTSKVEKMDLEAHKTADRLSEIGGQKDALERDVATMKTENDRLRFVKYTNVQIFHLCFKNAVFSYELKTRMRYPASLFPLAVKVSSRNLVVFFKQLLTEDCTYFSSGRPL